MVSSLAQALNHAARAASVSSKVLPLNRAGFISDVDVSNELVTRLEEGTSRLERPSSPAEFLEQVRQLNGLIATRYHAIALGFLAGVPMVAVLYDEKCVALAEQIELPREAMVTPEQVLSPSCARELVEGLISRPEEYRPQLRVQTAQDVAKAGLAAFMSRLGQAE